MAHVDEAAELRIHLLGRFLVVRDGIEIPSTAWKRRRPVELLTQVALAHGGVLHREEAIDRLWPEKDLEAGANNLYRALHDLRRSLGPTAITLERGAVRLGQGTWVDVTAFEHDVASTDVNVVARALTLYQGALLPDDPYSDALGARREALRQRFVDASLRVARSVDSIDAETRINALRRVVELDATIEEAQRALMLALALTGRKRDALKQFGRCTEALRARLDAAPARETLELRDAIEHDRIVRPLEPVSAEPADAGWRSLARRLVGADAPTPLRGRDGDLARADLLVAQQRGVLVVVGESGVGKSRFLVEVARRASGSGARVLTGLGYEFDGAAPYTSFVDAWSEYIARVGAPPSANPFHSFTPTAGASAQEDRLRLFLAIEQSIRALASDRWVMLAVEDLHQADESSLLLFHHLARAQAHLPLLLVGTLREEEVRVGNMLRTLLAGLKRERLGERVTLERLPLEATRALVADAQPDLDDSVVERVHELADGNPFFAQELARAASERGAQQPLTAPADLLDTVRERVRRLGRDAERLLVTAAVAGLRFEFDVIQRAAEMSPENALDALEHALEARLIAEDEQGYYFRHALVRSALYDSVSTARRVFLHRRVAAALESVASGARANSELLAFHHHAGGDLERALPYVLASIENAQSRLGFGEAVAHCGQALELMDALGEARTARRFEVLANRGTMRVALGDLVDAVVDLDEASAMTGGDFVPSPAARARCLRMAALALIEGGQHEEAERRLDDGMAILDEGNERPPAELSNLLYQYAQLRWNQSRHKEAYDLAERCLQEAERTDDPQSIAKGYEMLALACHSLGEWTEGRAYENKRQALADGALDVAGAFDVHL